MILKSRLRIRWPCRLRSHLKTSHPDRLAILEHAYENSRFISWDEIDHAVDRAFAGLSAADQIQLGRDFGLVSHLESGRSTRENARRKIKERKGSWERTQFRTTLGLRTGKGTRKESYFENCPRDDEGHCKPSGSGSSSPKPDKPKPEPESSAKIREGFHAIRRQEDGSYLTADGKPLPEEVHKRAKAMRLPPAWKDVQISSDPKNPLQASGRDAKGREQRVYSAEHSEKTAAEKFLRIKSLVNELPKLEKNIRATLAAESPEKESAAVLLLMRKTGFRIGSERDTKTEHEALGATTLTDKNVKINGDKIVFDFIGKKGVKIRQEIEDAELAAILGPRVKRGGKLFATDDAKVRDYLHSIDGVFKPKDLRTVVAAETALNAIRDISPPKTEKELKKAQLQVGKQVAAKLGNTPAIALKSYIPPEVFHQWQSKIAS